jgi:tetratricopeptide (TPR) repeat protein
MELQHILAQACLAAKQYPCALDGFKQILKKQPDSAAAHMLMGEALDGLGKTEEAIAEFQAAARVSPREPDVHFGLGYLHWKSHHYEEALREFQAELSVDPRHAQSLLYIGDIEMKRENLDAALDSLRKCIDIDKKLRLAYLDLGAVLFQKKAFPESVSALKRAIELAPSLPDAHYRLGQVYRAQGRSVEAQKEFETVRRLHDKQDRQNLADRMPSAASAPPSVR